MNAVAKHLAVGLDVRSVHPGACGVRRRRAVAGAPRRRRRGGLSRRGGAHRTGSAVARGVGRRCDGPDRVGCRAMGAIVYDPCLAVMVTMDGPSGPARSRVRSRRTVARSTGSRTTTSRASRTAHGITVHASASFQLGALAGCRRRDGGAGDGGGPGRHRARRCRWARRGRCSGGATPVRSTVLHPRPCLVVRRSAAAGARAAMRSVTRRWKVRCVREPLPRARSGELLALR